MLCFKCKKLCDIHLVVIYPRSFCKKDLKVPWVPQKHEIRYCLQINNTAKMTDKMS